MSLFMLQQVDVENQRKTCSVTNSSNNSYDNIFAIRFHNIGYWFMLYNPLLFFLVLVAQYPKTLGIHFKDGWCLEQMTSFTQQLTLI